MKVEMTFKDSSIISSGYKKADVYQTIKSSFTKRGLLCYSDNDVLAFEDTGNENDYAYMWNVIMSLLKSDWFINCAASCTFFDDDDSEEDVLSQAWKVQKLRA
ncbi:MAG: hypothetical protein EOM30_10745 [Clostridia bacterium]|nr:hypothetical protein [Clostridia bacterium]NLS85526.1 hypothetical protein [Oscillospiraceae bacterium]